MKYEMEELVPIVGKLAEKYTAHESSSITYEKAEQLMGAVLYCIHEIEEMGCHSLTLLNKEMSAQKAYEIGATYVEEKAKKALHFYHKILPKFDHYENQCLYDTFIKVLPEFFRRYDVRFEPQNTVVILDYPVLKDISAYTGIDKIYEFIACIRLEQKFLHVFPANYIINILSKYNKYGKESIDNISETVFTNVIGHILAEKSLTKFDLEKADYSYIQEVFMHTDLNAINKRMENAVEAFVKNYCENDGELLSYLSDTISGILIRLKNAADNKAIESMI